MPLSWNEIKSRAAHFAYEWRDTTREEADAKPFLIEFLNIFGVSRKRVATFEHRVKKVNESAGYIDLLWSGTLLVEMKSRGQDLDKAYKQAKDYCHGLMDYELPKLIMICDFHLFHIYRDDGLTVRFELSQLVENLQIFEELAGYQKRSYYEEDPVNIAAAELMGRLHDKLKEVGYTGHDLEVYLVRLLFILFADDSTIWQGGLFLDYLELRTKDDGSDLAMHLDQLFQVLDTPEDRRLKTLDEQLNMFPYVNGRLFRQRLATAAFNSHMRQILLDCCRLDWGKISPAIFGSLFQSVMDEENRRNLGAHYTSEKNIMKLIKPLFVDDLWDEFHAAGDNHNKLRGLHSRISKLRFLDPACGCGNFLITAYRELRLIELAIVEKLLKGQMVTNINQYFLVDLDQFYGIELGEFASQIAQVAMWLIDHQMNMLVSEKFGEYIPLIPLLKSAVIVNDNALSLDWHSIIQPLEGEQSPPKFDYILGNPPFRGHHLQTSEQKEDLNKVLIEIQASGVMDYVTAWYMKSVQYLSQYNRDNKIRVAFVSTNSITQGEQVGILWSVLMKKYGIKIHFAHQTFRWSNEAKNIAAVYCVIVGFSNFNISRKQLYTYDSIKGEPEVHHVDNINSYLVDSPDIFILNRAKPICKVPVMLYGSKPSDGGHLILSEEEKVELVRSDERAVKYIRPFISAKEFLHNENRFCLWLLDADPSEVKSIKGISERVEKVRQFRQTSVAASTRNYPYHGLFRQLTQPKSDYILVPAHTSERRIYIPFGFIGKDVILSNASFSIESDSLFHFGVISSMMHMIWVKYTCGRLKSDYRYSKDIVYNNFPWPEVPAEQQKQSVEQAAQAVLEARALFPNNSLADLYDPNTMPPVLVRAHQQLDKAVDHCYRPQQFVSEVKRIEFLFELYDKYTAGLFATEKLKKVKVKTVNK
jgi:hypothetical protein